MSSKKVCYMGYYSTKPRTYTRKNYLALMNKDHKKECAVHKKSLKCNSCKKSKEMFTKETMKHFKKQLKDKTYKVKWSKKTEEKLVKQMNKCKTCKNKNLKKCNFNDYILFSGAELGKCQKTL